MPTVVDWDTRMMQLLHKEYARLLGMKRCLLPIWKAQVLEHNRQRRDSFCFVYTTLMVDKVFEEKEVDLNDFVTNLICYLVVFDASPNIYGWSRAAYPADTDLTRAYMNAAIEDYKKVGE